MKKILSIASVSIISTALFTATAGAASTGCDHTFESYTARINCKNCCKTSEIITSKQPGFDSIIEELLKDCEVKFFDECPIIQDRPQVPDTEDQIPEDNTEKPVPDKPVIPDNKPDTETENDQSGGQNITENQFAQKILELVNKERTSHGLSPVTADNQSLNNAASKRASEQAVSFSHTRPNGTSWTTVLNEYSVKYGSAGENVAYGQRTPEEVMQAWMNSSGHRANILNAVYKEIGVGVYYKNGTYYWSQLFIG